MPELHHSHAIRHSHRVARQLDFASRMHQDFGEARNRAAAKRAAFRCEHGDQLADFTPLGTGQFLFLALGIFPRDSAPPLDFNSEMIDINPGLVDSGRMSLLGRVAFGANRATFLQSAARIGQYPHRNRIDGRQLNMRGTGWAKITPDRSAHLVRMAIAPFQNKGLLQADCSAVAALGHHVDRMSAHQISPCRQRGIAAAHLRRLAPIRSHSQ
jgi:hypothetical protein